MPMLRRCGVKEVHFRISCPPIISSCFYGIDTPRKEKLIAHNMNVQEMAEFLGVDTLAFQTIEGMVDATGLPLDSFCLACFNNDYPTALPSDFESNRKGGRIEDMSTDLAEVGLGGRFMPMGWGGG